MRGRLVDGSFAIDAKHAGAVALIFDRSTATSRPRFAVG
jgi:hypothetical protein